MRAANVLAGAAPFAFPVTQSGEEDDFVARLPRRVTRLVHHAGSIGGDHAGRVDALGAVRQPEVQVVDRRRPDDYRDGTRSGPAAGSLADPDAGRAGRFLVDGGPSLAQN